MRILYNRCYCKYGFESQKVADLDNATDDRDNNNNEIYRSNFRSRLDLKHVNYDTGPWSVA